MGQIMGLPADDLLKPHCKDMTAWEKGRYAGYKAAIWGVCEVINGAFVQGDDFDKEIEAANRMLVLLRCKVVKLMEGET